MTGTVGMILGLPSLPLRGTGATPLRFLTISAPSRQSTTRTRRGLGGRIMSATRPIGLESENSRHSPGGSTGVLPGQPRDAPSISTDNSEDASWQFQIIPEFQVFTKWRPIRTKQRWVL